MFDTIRQEDLEKVRILGEGTYGKCYLVHNKKNDELCVLKQIEIFGMTETELEEVEREARILSALKHPCIVKFITFFKTDSYLNILMEYADGGDLNKKIKEAKGTLFTENDILNWFTQICLAIKHIHDRKVIHRDLKCQNIFMTKEGNVKLGDFGIARHLSRTLDKIKTVVGTPYYMSPEICQNKDYSFKTDIWSLGVILYEMCAQKLPFDGNSLPVLALRIAKGEYTPITTNYYSRDLKKLISSLLQSNPNRRPTIIKLLQHPLIQKRVNNYLPENILAKEFSHTTLHSHNLFQKQNDIENNSQQDNIDMIGLKKIKSKGSNNSKNAICAGQKIDLAKIINSTPILEADNDKKLEVHSARSQASKLSNKFQSSKNLDYGNKFSVGNGSQVTPNVYTKEQKDKKKKIESFKRRQISEPILVPKRSIQSSESLPPIEQTQRKESNKQTIQETLTQLVQEKFGEDFQDLLNVLDSTTVITEQPENGLLTLLWGYRKFKEKL